jgi:hypothetical protein
VLELRYVHDKMRTLEAHSISLEAQKFRAPMQPVCRREAQLRSHRIVSLAAWAGSRLQGVRGPWHGGA